MIDLTKHTPYKIDLIKRKPYEDRYALLKQDLICIFNPQICSINYICHDPEPVLYSDSGKLNPTFYSSKRRDSLMWKYKCGVAKKNLWICILLMIPITLIMIGIVGAILWFIPNDAIAILLGLLLYQGVFISWYELTDKFEIEAWPISDRKKRKIKYTK